MAAEEKCCLLHVGNGSSCPHFSLLCFETSVLPNPLWQTLPGGHVGPLAEDRTMVITLPYIHGFEASFILEAVHQARAEAEQQMCKGSILQPAKHPPVLAGSHSQHLAASGPFLWTVKSLSSFPVWHLTSLGKRLMNWLAFNRFYEARQEHASTDRILNAFSREASPACCVSVQQVCV